MSNIKVKLEEKLIPRLIELFQNDMTVFDEVIKNRELRDNYRISRSIESTRNFIEAKSKAEKGLFAATSITIEISTISHDLARMGMYVFKKGCKSVRGDSAVAIQNSLAVMIGCVHIAELNIKSLVNHEEFEDFELELKKICSDYEKILTESKIVLKKLGELIEKKKNKIHLLSQILEARSSSDVEKVVLEFQKKLIEEYNEVDWTSDTIPEEALRFLEYEISKDHSLGAFNDFDGRIETAGIIDNVKKTVWISSKFKPTVQRFTLAHELGHAVLHYKSLRKLHRDMDLESRIDNPRRDFIEVQADNFAAFFLMPRLEMQRQFSERFQTKKLVINDDVAFFLGLSLREIKKRFKERRQLSRFIASTTIYAGKSFDSLANQFKVSVEAMAIQIEELDLIDFKFIGY